MLQSHNYHPRFVQTVEQTDDDFWKVNDIDYDIEVAEKEAEKSRQARAVAERLERSAPSMRFINLETVKPGPQRSEIVGEAVVFNLYSDVKPRWGDSEFECRLIVRPGAFTKCLELGLPIPLRLGHEGSAIASTRDGSLELLETARGLSIRARPYDNPYANSVVAGIRSGKYREMSFQHDAARGQLEWTRYKGLPCAVLHQAELLDVAICAKGAFSDGPSCWLTEAVYRKGDMSRCVR